MDRKQHKITPEKFIFLIILVFSLVPSGCCFLFLMPRYGKDFKKPLVKSISIDSNNIVTIILDNANKSKRIGEIHALDLLSFSSVLEYEKNDDEIIIKKDISKYKEKLTEDNQYRIEIKWYGGHLFLETVFQNGQFTVLKEKYLDRI